jgi:hypothetical protein
MTTQQTQLRLAAKMAQLLDRPSPTACWTWEGPVHRHGYVRVYVHGTGTSLPRAAWFLAFGGWPHGRLARLPHCTAGIRCGNPAHYQERANKERRRAVMATIPIRVFGCGLRAARAHHAARR